MGKNPLEEIEKTLIDQLEKLNDDSLFNDAEEAKKVVERSKAMSELSKNLVEINRLKLDAVRIAANFDGVYDDYLGIPNTQKAIK